MNITDKHLIQWLEKNSNIEIGVKYDDGELIRVVYKKVGSMNDQEWVVLSENASLREALIESVKGEMK